MPNVGLEVHNTKQKAVIRYGQGGGETLRAPTEARRADQMSPQQETILSGWQQGSRSRPLPPAELSENAIKRGQRRERVFLYLPLSVVMTHSVELAGKYKEAFKTEENDIMKVCWVRSGSLGLLLVREEVGVVL